MHLLTPRQQVLVHRRCRLGETWAEAAFALGISPHTAKNHATELFDRLGARCCEEVCYRLGREDGQDGWRPNIPAARADDV